MFKFRKSTQGAVPFKNHLSPYVLMIDRSIDKPVARHERLLSWGQLWLLQSAFHVMLKVHLLLLLLIAILMLLLIVQDE